MDIWQLVVAVYILITAMALTMTWREQVRTGRRSPLMSVLGILACTLWPLALAVFFVAIRWLKLRQRVV